MTEPTIHAETIEETRELKELQYRKGGGFVDWKDRPTIGSVTQSSRMLIWDSKDRQTWYATVDQLAERLKSLQEEGAGSWEVEFTDYGESLTAFGPEDKTYKEKADASN